MNEIVKEGYIDIVDRTSVLFPEHNKPEELANPFFESSRS